MTCSICNKAPGILPYKGKPCCPDCFKDVKKADRKLQKKVQNYQCMERGCYRVPIESGYCGEHDALHTG